tara:strand:- start:1008 stop:1472 length:465 start_codon:yes stop_codon:yes gene_type:complete
MSSKFDGLNESFNVESTEVEVDETPENGCAPRKDQLSNVTNVGITKPDRLTQDDITKDYEYTRGNLYSIIEKGQEAINGILELAQESEMPRAYEVAGQLIKSVSDATDKLMDLQKKLKDVNEEKESKGPTTVNNALFVGSTAELQKLLKQNGKP